MSALKHTKLQNRNCGTSSMCTGTLSCTRLPIERSAACSRDSSSCSAHSRNAMAALSAGAAEAATATSASREADRETDSDALAAELMAAGAPDEDAVCARASVFCNRDNSRRC